MFVIPCKFNQNNPTIYECIDSIKKFHPFEKIVVVDSDSEDKSYFSKIENNNVTILDLKNKNYVIGAFWLAVDNFEKEDVYLLHDSMILKDNLSIISQSDVCSIRYFRSWYGVGGIFPNGKYHYGYDTEQQLLWSMDCFKKNNLNIKTSYFNGVFGSSFYCKNKIINNLRNLNFNRILPENKWQDQAMERNLGIIFHQIGCDHAINSILGEHHENPYENKYLKKILSGRQ